jgi:hypothetical protein
MIKKYLVDLTTEEIEELNGILNRGRHSAQKRKRAQALLLAHAGKTDQDIADIVGMHRRGIEQLRQRFVEEGYETTLNGKAHTQGPPLIGGEDELRLIALAREKKPEGLKRHSLRYLSDKFTTLDGLKVSHETIRRVLKKTKQNRGREKNGTSARKASPGS